jgi:nucleotide-binding universal stress UspA family protein
MTVNSILVPTDFSEPSDAALHYATDMARTLGARLFLLHVPGKTGENLEMNFPVAQFETAAHQRLDTFVSPSDIERLRPEYAVRIGTPAEEIVRYANERDIDLIIRARTAEVAWRTCCWQRGRAWVVAASRPGTARPPPQDRCRQGRRHKRSSERRGSAQEGGPLHLT